MSIGFNGTRPPELFNMARYVIGQAAQAMPLKPGLLVYRDASAAVPSEVWTYAQLEQAVLRLGGGLLAEGVEPGDRLLIRLDNTSSYALLFFGAIAAGIVPIPASSQLTAREAAFLLNDSGAKAIAAAQHLPPVAQRADLRVFDEAWIDQCLHHADTGASMPYAPTRADDPAYLVYTSGTTSNPKGVLHAHRAAWGRRPMYRDWYGLTQSDRVLHAGAFNWTYTLGTGLTDPWANGATAIVYTGAKDPTVWPQLIAKSKATIFAAVPTLYRQILKYTDIAQGDLTGFRHGLTAGEALPDALAEEWTARTGTRLYEALGMSELSTFLSSSPTTPPKAGAVGRPQAGRLVVILPLEPDATGASEPLPPEEKGLLAVHRTDPGLMLGYWQRPDEEKEAFRGEWFIGGDVASMDEDGYITHHGRANDLMNAMGYRVSPLEVEQVLSTHPSVAEVAVAEVMVRDGVTIIAAFIVVRDGAAGDKDDILRHAEQNLAAYKRPRDIRFVETLPRTPNGKIKRAALRVL